MQNKYLTHNWLIHQVNKNIVVRHASIIKGVVYDLGCGEKPYQSIILQTADSYVGVDWTNSIHDKRMDVVADLNTIIPISGEVADTVVSFQVMEHLCEPQNFLNEAFRILKKGGHILLVVPFQWYVHEAPYDYYRYTCHGLEYLFRKAGFADIQAKPVMGFWYSFIMKFNYHSTRWITKTKLGWYIIRWLLVPFWWLGQVLAPFLDKIDHNDTETAGYVVTATKK